MTTQERFKKMLIDCGMSDNQADAVLEIAIPRIESAAPNYRITWDRPAEEYPDVLYNTWWLYLKDAALEWIEENIPQAWFRSMFE